MKIRLVGGHSHGRQLEWDLKSGDAIQCPYRENVDSMDPLDVEFGIELYTIRKFTRERQITRWAVRVDLWYVAVVSSMTDAQANGYSHMIAYDLSHQHDVRDSTPAEKAQWDARTAPREN